MFQENPGTILLYLFPVRFSRDPNHLSILGNIIMCQGPTVVLNLLFGSNGSYNQGQFMVALSSRFTWAFLPPFLSFSFFSVRNASPRTFLVFPSFDSCGTQLETSHSLLENNVESENTKICVRKPAVSHSDTKRIQLDIVPLMRNCNYRSSIPLQ